MKNQNRNPKIELKVENLEGAARLLQKAMRGKDLPIEPLDPREWDFRKCRTWESARCWEYEFHRESTRVLAEIDTWRTAFQEWVDRSLKRDDEKPSALEQEEYSQKRDQLEALYIAFESPISGWLLRDFPEFPRIPYLGIDHKLRRDRLAKLGFTESNPTRIFPLSTISAKGFLNSLVGDLVVLDTGCGGSNPDAAMTAWRAKIAQAIGNDHVQFQNHWITRRLGDGCYVTDVVVSIPWNESNKRLSKRFEALLEKLRGELPEKTRITDGSGSTNPRDMLNKLGAFRLLRHCRGDWKLAAELSSRVLPNGRALYQNQSRWNTAEIVIRDLLLAALGDGGFKPIR